MNIVFRVDASAAIGSGHLMRCLALADTLREHGAATLFITRAAEQPWRELLRQHGHAVATFPSEHADAARDAAETRAVLAGKNSPDWLVVDHYSLGKEWETTLRASCKRIFAIDDIERPHDCDLLLDQNALADEHVYRDLVPVDCKRLLGPRYALLRTEFGKQRENCPAREGAVRRILINFGGSDPTQETVKSLDAFLAARLDDTIHADVILGSVNPNTAAILQRYGGNPRLNLLTHADHMATTMAGVDLAIGAGGVSMWERACLGLPSIAIIAADNQRRGAEWLAAQGGHLLLGDSAAVTAQDIAKALSCLADNPRLRALFAHSSAALVDGRGCQRIARRLLGDRITLRPVTATECDTIYAWRNAEINRRFSGDEQPFSIKTHRQWFAAMLVDPSRIMLIGEDGREPVGVLRFDLAGVEAVISVYLAPGRHDMGWGETLLNNGTRWLRAHHPEITTVRARVSGANLASLSVFGRAGYVEQERTLILSLHNTP